MFQELVYRWYICLHTVLHVVYFQEQKWRFNSACPGTLAHTTCHSENEFGNYVTRPNAGLFKFVPD